MAQLLREVRAKQEVIISKLLLPLDRRSILIREQDGKCPKSASHLIGLIITETAEKPKNTMMNHDIHVDQPETSI